MDSLSGCDIRVQEPRGGNKLKRYELIFIALSDLSKDEIDTLIDRYKDIVSRYKGTVVKVEKWGIRKLAYKIEKQGKGFYTLMDFVGDAATVNEVERNFKFDDKVLRFLTIKKADAVNLKEIENEMSGAREEKVEEPKPEPAQSPVQPPEEHASPVEAAVGTSSDAEEKAEEGGKE
jgi:small subunit ribosomal protein S6